ncbi:primosomal protein N' [uncultured Cellulomonas sp.]|uniref:primosomal protein N' n=1 Tax=uncultured Cellulomonas sp. TaxID=189682 RepID=UPI00260F5831|nr:primosomal protein N' [uncultured Cellulomonas sp.]
MTGTVVREAEGAVPHGEQGALAGLPAPRPRRPRAAGPVEPAPRLPVARVLVDVPAVHLDRTFEYLVPASVDDDVRPGCRVKVRFGPRDVDGFVLDRVEEAEHDGELAPLRRVVSPVAVLSPEVLRLARAVADRYAGTLGDVLRLAVPPRHARVEAEVGAGGPGAAPASEPAGGVVVADSAAPDDPAAPADAAPAARAWDAYRGGPAFLEHLAASRSPRAVWTALPGAPGQGWPDAVAQAVAATVRGGRGAVVVLPDARDVERVVTALPGAGVPAWSAGRTGGFVRLEADHGPAPRYRAFLAALTGAAPVVVGTRAAAWAPVADLGLVVCWDDADDLHAEPRSPYPHVREVLTLRAEQSGSAALIGGLTRTTQAQGLVASGWARPLVADRAVVRERTPRVQALTSVELAREGPAAAARLPAPAWRAARDALATGPVLVQVPRAGYLPVVACARCRAVARCRRCAGPLALGAAGQVPQCRWCGTLAGGWRCAECGSAALRSVRVGSDRTAEELGRAFPGVPVRVSGATAATGVLATVDARPALVVATPGAEPVADGGYPAALLLDAAVSTARAALRVGEEALHRWMTAAALVRPASAGGRVLLVGDAAPAPTQALVRWDPVGFAERELAERVELDLPPAVRVAAVTGTRDAVETFLARVRVPEGGAVLGPVPVDPSGGRDGAAALEHPVRALVRVPVSAGPDLAAGLAASAAVRSARREGGTVRVQIDPKEML